MKKNIFLIALCFIVAGAILTVPVMADTGSIDFYEAGAFSTYSSSASGSELYSASTAYDLMHTCFFGDIGEYQGTLFTLEGDYKGIWISGVVSSECNFAMNYGGDEIGHGIVFYTSRYDNSSNQIGADLIYYFQTWDASGLDDETALTVTYTDDADGIGTMTTHYYCKTGTNNLWQEPLAAAFDSDRGFSFVAPGYYVKYMEEVHASQIVLQTIAHDQTLTYESNSAGIYEIDFTRNGISNLVTINGQYDGKQLYHGTSDVDFTVYGSDVNYNIYVENIAAGADWEQTMLSGTEAPADPTDTNESISMQLTNLANGANIPGTLNFTEGVNSSVFNLASGYGSVDLEPEISYNVTATASGFETLNGIIWFDSSTAITVQGSTGYITRTGSASTDNLAYKFSLEPTYTGEDENFSVYNVVVTGEGAGALAGAGVTIDGISTKVANNAGGASFTISRNTAYSVSITYPGFQSFNYPINLTTSTYTDYITLQIDPTGVYATPTPTPDPDDGESGESATYVDLRTNEQKTEDALAIWFDNTEVIAQLALMVVILSLIGWLIPKKRR